MPRKSLRHLTAASLCECGEGTVAMKKSQNAHNKGQYVVQSEKCRVCLNLLSKYGIDRTTRDRIHAEQDGCCELCASPLEFGTFCKDGMQRTSAVVDHCHTTGKFRGILCSVCNVSLGKAGDDPALLRRMADYLEKHDG